MIKYKGFSIAPAELEAVLVEHSAVQESAVVGVPDEEAGEIPKAFVVLHGDGSERITDEELITFVNGKVTGYKILRRELKELERARRAGEPVSFNS